MNKIIIIGKQASGKFQLLKEFEEAGFKTLKTHTTRPKRYDGEDTYIFHDNIESIDPSSMFLKEEINGHIYFTTVDDLLAADVMTLTPEGALEALQWFPSIGFKFLYLIADDKKRLKKIKERNISDIERKKRKDFDDEQFKEINKVLEDRDPVFFEDNALSIEFVENNYKDKHTGLINKLYVDLVAEVNLYYFIKTISARRILKNFIVLDDTVYIDGKDEIQIMPYYDFLRAMEDEDYFKDTMLAFLSQDLGFHKVYFKRFRLSQG